MARFILVLAAVVFCGCDSSGSNSGGAAGGGAAGGAATGGTPAAAGNSITATAEGEAVDKYVHEVLGSPAYTVVRWWPPVASEEARDVVVKAAQEAMTSYKGAFQATPMSYERARDAQLKGEPIEEGTRKMIKFVTDAEATIEELKDQKTVRICRLKFAVKDGQGNTAVEDHIFRVKADGTVTEATVFERKGLTALFAE